MSLSDKEQGINERYYHKKYVKEFIRKLNNIDISLSNEIKVCGSCYTWKLLFVFPEGICFKCWLYKEAGKQLLEDSE